MVPTYFFESWANGTSNWILDSGLALNTTQPISSPYSLTGSPGSEFATAINPDNNNGKIQISMEVYVSSGVTATTWCGAVWRAVSSPLSAANNSYYWAYLQYDSSMLNTVIFGKTISGVKTTIAEVVCVYTAPGSNLSNKWCNLIVLMDGQSINIQLQHPSGNYLSPLGTFNPGSVSCISLNDSSIPATSGYLGIWEQNATSQPVYAGNFRIAPSYFRDNFESGTSNWILSGSTLSSAYSWSPTHSLTGSIGSNFATYNITDYNGSVEIGLDVNVQSGPATTWGGCVWRATQSPLSTASILYNSYYWAYIQWNGSFDSLIFGQTISGAKYIIKAINTVAIGSLTNRWLSLDVNCPSSSSSSSSSSSLGIQVRDLSTGKYLNPSGSMQTGSINAIAIALTNATIPAAPSYFGIWQQCQSGQNVYVDNFSLSLPNQAQLISTIAFTGTGKVAHKARVVFLSAIVPKVNANPTIQHRGKSSLAAGTTGIALKAKGNCSLKAHALLFGGINSIIANATVLGKYSALIINTPPVINAADVATGLLYFWQLNENSGTTAFDCKDSNNGSYHGGITLNQPAPPTIDCSALFDGSTGYISTSKVENFTPSIITPGITFETWIYPTAIPTTNALIVGLWQAPSTHTFNLYLAANSLVPCIDFTDTSLGSHTLTSSMSLTLNQWYHICVTGQDGIVIENGLNNQGVNFYVNGFEVAASNTYTIGPLAMGYTSPNIWIGGLPPQTPPNIPYGYFAGRLTEVAVYNCTLTTTQIQTHANASGTGYSIYVSQDVAEVLASNNPFVHMSQDVAEVIVYNNPTVCLSQSVAEVLAVNNPLVHVSQNVVEVLRSTNSVSGAVQWVPGLFRI